MRLPDFDVDATFTHFNMPREDLVDHLRKSRPDIEGQLDGLATGAVIFSKHNTHDTKQQQRMLLVQRAASDSMPNKWEIPGGSVDAGETVLEGVAREALEESGLRVTRVRGLLRAPDAGAETEGLEGGFSFAIRRGTKLIVKYTFVVDVEDADKVQLDPKEHQDYVWATEEECRSKRVARQGRPELTLEFSMAKQEEMILKAFAEYTKP